MSDAPIPKAVARMLHEICETGDLITINNQVFVLAEVSWNTVDALSTFEAEAADLEDGDQDDDSGNDLEDGDVDDDSDSDNAFSVVWVAGQCVADDGDYEPDYRNGPFP